MDTLLRSNKPVEPVSIHLSKRIAAAVAMAVILHLPAIASDKSLGGVWTKTTHPDPKNIAVFYVDGQIVKAISYGMIAERPAVWYAEGNLQDRHINLTYRYSMETTPNGWESEGVMQLRLSEDGKTTTLLSDIPVGCLV